MESIGIRELNQQTSKVLRAVAATGESVAVTDHGRRVAMIVPVPASRYQEMVDTGLIVEGAAEVRSVPRVRVGGRSEDVLRELREDRV